MKTILTSVSAMFMAAHLLAQTNQPVRLALIVEALDAATAGNVLTAELTKNPNIHLLERTEIEKAYREQGLSAGNKDYLKLGQILGADGLWVLEINRTTLQTNLMARLIAVKPGVVLLEESFTWPLQDLSGWSPLVVNHLNPFLPKLTVLVKDAIPISVVNLRSAIQTSESLEAEKQLKLLTIQRLSREKQLFVLERQRMGLLSEEKELKADDSAFWNGSYLLEGVVDQNGYSKETITINARLTPPKGGTAIPIEVRGSRTNFAEVINQLAMKVNEALKVASTVKEWNAADEAQQYFEEAKWALKWGLYSEAQSAADSAWALGKRDMECATVRVKAYVNEVEQHMDGYRVERGWSELSDADIQEQINGLKAAHPSGFAYKIRTERRSELGTLKSTAFVFAERPDPENLERAVHVMRLYDDFSRTLPLGEPAAASPWYNVGLDGLVSSGQILQLYNFVWDAQESVADKLADLRRLCRSVSDWIGKSSSVQKAFWLGIQPHHNIGSGYSSRGGYSTRDDYTLDDELITEEDYRALIKAQNIFSLKLRWGCFWQERPEDSIALYRELTDCLIFTNMHKELWNRELEAPRLAAWSDGDRTRTSTIWNSFVEELCASTNSIMRREGMAFKFSNTNGEPDIAAGWAAAGPEIRKWEEAERNKRTPEQIQREAENTNLQKFEMQKRFLREHQRFDTFTFNRLFMAGFRDYSKAQAAELIPLLAAYGTNLIEKGDSNHTEIVHMTEEYVKRKLNPSPITSTQPPTFVPSRPNPIPRTSNEEELQSTNPSPVTIARAALAAFALKSQPEVATNILIVRNFFGMPREFFPTGKYPAGFSPWAIKLRDQKLWFASADNNFLTSWDLQTRAWAVFHYPVHDSDNSARLQWLNPPHFEVFNGAIYSSEFGKIERFEFQKRRWEILPIPVSGFVQLFVINGHLYAGNIETIIEILNDGQSTSILASCRRRPAATILDSLDTLNLKGLFAAPDGSLCARLGDKIYSWNGHDWEEFETPPSDPSSEIFRDGIVVNTFPYDPTADVWLLPNGRTNIETSYHVERRNFLGLIAITPRRSAPQIPKTIWKPSPEIFQEKMEAALVKTNLYFYVEKSIVKPGNPAIAGSDRDGDIICLNPDLPTPIDIPIRFDLEHGLLPSRSVHPAQYTGYAFLTPREDSILIVQNTAPGVWEIPNSELESAVNREKERWLAENSLFMARFDLNHDGVLDTNERENALGDPAFILSEMGVIDANQDGFISFDELEYFDVNSNKLLETQELVGINIAQQLLATRRFKESDSNRDGILDQNEFNAMYQASSKRPPPDLPYKQRVQGWSLVDLESFLNTQLVSKLPYIPPTTQGPFGSFVSDQKFKTSIEAYWKAATSRKEEQTKRTP